MTAETESCPIAAFENAETKQFGVQFHPEVTHTDAGRAILENYVLKICGCQPSVEISGFVEEAIKVLPEYYASVGQHLNKWIPKPPQIKAEQNKKVVDSVESAEIVNPFWIPPVTQTE